MDNHDIKGDPTYIGTFIKVIISTAFNRNVVLSIEDKGITDIKQLIRISYELSFAACVRLMEQDITYIIFTPHPDLYKSWSIYNNTNKSEIDLSLSLKSPNLTAPSRLPIIIDGSANKASGAIFAVIKQNPNMRVKIFIDYSSDYQAININRKILSIYRSMGKEKSQSLIRSGYEIQQVLLKTYMVDTESAVKIINQQEDRIVPLTHNQQTLCPTKYCRIRIHRSREYKNKSINLIPSSYQSLLSYKSPYSKANFPIDNIELDSRAVIVSFGKNDWIYDYIKHMRKDRPDITVKTPDQIKSHYDTDIHVLLVSYSQLLSMRFDITYKYLVIMRYNEFLISIGTNQSHREFDPDYIVNRFDSDELHVLYMVNDSIRLVKNAKTRS
ncbi:MAG: hypothetical protein GY751_11085 [Bacteroidetes bacterium]|nr:hypothetical protein [Bacteroidota bacterium]